MTQIGKHFKRCPKAPTRQYDTTRLRALARASPATAYYRYRRFENIYGLMTETCPGRVGFVLLSTVAGAFKSSTTNMHCDGALDVSSDFRSRTRAGSDQNNRLLPTELRAGRAVSFSANNSNHVESPVRPRVPICGILIAAAAAAGISLPSVCPSVCRMFFVPTRSCGGEENETHALKHDVVSLAPAHTFTRKRSVRFVFTF